MVVTYEDLAQTLIPNTTMQKMSTNGVHKAYRIKPLAGYVLHDNTMDINAVDPETMEEVFKFGYSPSSVYVTCGAAYDFSTHTVTDEKGNTHIAYGNRDFFAISESDVPVDQII